jgi:release factor glutamine methyltransferase
MLDLCTGSGCIPILLAHKWPRGSIQAHGVDISPEALSLASENAADHQILPSTDRASTGNTFDVTQADILHESFASAVLPKLRPPFDLLTSNPPYIPINEYNALPPSVKDYEDSRALLGDPVGEDRGLTFYRQIAKLVSSHGILKHQGLVVLEVGKGQAGEVKGILENEGRIMFETEIWKDPWGVERVVLGKFMAEL